MNFLSLQSHDFRLIHVLLVLADPTCCCLQDPYCQMFSYLGGPQLLFYTCINRLLTTSHKREMKLSLRSCFLFYE